MKIRKVSKSEQAAVNELTKHVAYFKRGKKVYRISLLDNTFLRIGKDGIYSDLPKPKITSYIEEVPWIGY